MWTRAACLDLQPGDAVREGVVDAATLTSNRKVIWSHPRPVVEILRRGVSKQGTGFVSFVYECAGLRLRQTVLEGNKRWIHGGK